MEPFWARIKSLSHLLKTSKRPIILTGAGLSTNSGIPDYRSGMDTQPPTGPGIWNFKGDDSFWQRILESRRKTLLATPSFSHMAIAELVNLGYIDHLISQNVDGLHLKSGIPQHKITELHGNLFSEIWNNWHTIYLRKFRTRNKEDKSHSTGRKCDKEDCHGELQDTLVLFGESIPKEKLEVSLKKAQNSELWIWIGSSLVVKPAATFPMIVKKNGKLAIINMDHTPLDGIADVRFGGNWDMIMKALMEEMRIEVPDYIQSNSLKITKSNQFLEIIPENLNHSKIKNVELFLLDEKSDMTTEEKPYRFELPLSTSNWQLRINFEKDKKKTLELDFDISKLQQRKNTVIAKYNSFLNEWADIQFKTR